jgi:hypothetical protein
VHVFDSSGWENAMRGDDERSEGFFSYVRLETRIAADHPLRSIRELVDRALRELSPAFDRVYAREGRPSIPPERLLRALLLQAFYTVRSERQLMEQLDYNPSATSMARSAGTIRIPRPPTPTPDCSAKPPAKRPSSATWGI